MTDYERYFQTGRVRSDLRGRTLRSGMVAAGANGAQILLQIGSIMVLARILTPEDFGVVAMVLPVALLTISVANLGLQSAIIHTEPLLHASASELFWFAARMNLVVVGAMAAIGPLLARLFGEPRLTIVAGLWAVAIYMGTLGAVHESLLKRQLRFGTVMSIRVVALTAGATAAICGAFLGAGYWALILQILTFDVVRTALLWGLCGWRPARRGTAGDATSRPLRDMRSYWREVAGFRLVAWSGEQLDRVLIGLTGGAAVLGLYDRSRKWAWYPFMELFYALYDVALASFSRVRGDATEYRAFVRRGLLPMFALPLPIIAFVFAEARNIVLILFGHQWLDAVPFLRLMSVAIFFGSASQLMQWLYLSSGKTARQFRWAMISTPIMAGSVLVGALWGATGVAIGFTVGTCLLAGPSVAWALAGSPVGWRDVGSVAWRPAVASILSASLLQTGRDLLPSAGVFFFEFLVSGIVFAALYVGLWAALPGGRSASREVLAAFRDLRRRPGGSVRAESG